MNAQTLELVRQVVQSMELNAAAYGIDPDDIVLAWTAQTQSVTRTPENFTRICTTGTY